MKANASSIAAKARQILGGTLSANQYKDYVLALLFLKSVNEHYKSNGYIQPDDSKPPFRLLVPERSSFDYLCRELESPELGRLINIALLELEEANNSANEGIEIGKAIDFENNILGETNERRNKLRELLLFFQNMTFADDMGNAMDYGLLYNQLLYIFAEEAGKKIDNVFTPKEVVDLMAGLVDDKINPSLCDPASSSGALLVEVGKKLACKGSNIYGQEVNGNLYALTKMNLMLNGFKNFTSQWGDSLSNPKLTDNKRLKLFDIVVSAPPFADKWGAEEAKSDLYGRFGYGIPPKSQAAWAYIGHILASLQDNGQAVVVVPSGVLFRNNEHLIRQQIIEDNLLEAIIELPQNLFYGTAISTAILVFRRGRESKNTLFIDARKGCIMSKGINKFSDTYVEHLVDIYKRLFNEGHIDQEEGHFAYIASQDEIRNNKYNLQVSKYIEVRIEREEIDVKETVRKIQILEDRWAYVNRQLILEIQQLEEANHGN